MRFPASVFEYLNRRPFDLPPEHRIPARLPWHVLRRGPGGASVAVDHVAPASQRGRA